MYVCKIVCSSNPRPSHSCATEESLLVIWYFFHLYLFSLGLGLIKKGKRENCSPKIWLSHSFINLLFFFGGGTDFWILTVRKKQKNLTWKVRRAESFYLPFYIFNTFYPKTHFLNNSARLKPYKIGPKKDSQTAGNDFQVKFIRDSKAGHFESPIFSYKITPT